MKKPFSELLFGLLAFGLLIRSFFLAPETVFAKEKEVATTHDDPAVDPTDHSYTLRQNHPLLSGLSSLHSFFFIPTVYAKETTSPKLSFFSSLKHFIASLFTKPHVATVSTALPLASSSPSSTLHLSTYNSPATTTIIQKTTVIERTPVTEIKNTYTTGISEQQLNQKLSDLEAKLTSKLFSLPQTSSITQGTPSISIPSVTHLIAESQKIDKLSGADISNTAITDSTITNTPISGSSGSFTSLTATSISSPTIDALNVSISNSGSSTPTFGYITATTTNATSTFAGNLSIGTTTNSGAQYQIGGLGILTRIGTAIIGGDLSGRTRGAGALDIQSTRLGSTTAVAAGQYSTAIGISNRAGSFQSSAFGYNNAVYSDGSTASGYGNVIAPNGAGGTASGYQNIVRNASASAFGTSNIASGVFSLAVGGVNSASGYRSSASGYGNSASGNSASASGYHNTASGEYSTAVGTSNTANGKYSFASGRFNTASGYKSSTSGYLNTASATSSSAFGYQNIASATSSLALGSSNVASGAFSSASGYGNQATKLNASASGYANVVSGQGATASGYFNTVSARSSSAFGSHNTVSGYRSSASGYYNTASGKYSSSFGFTNTASSYKSSTFGSNLTVSINGSSAFGSNITNSIATSTMIGPTDAAKLTIRGDVGRVGFIGIGTTTPAAQLSIVQQANATTSGLMLAATDQDYRAIYMDTTGILHFAGGDGQTVNNASLNAAGAWTNASDLAYKENITDLSTKYGLTTILNTSPRFYLMKGSHLPQVGFIAQELKPLIPEVVDGEEGSLGISYGNLVAVAFQGIKDLNAKVETLLASSTSLMKEWVGERVTATVGLFKRIEGDEIVAKKICLEDLCITKEEFKTLLAGAHISGTEIPAPAAGAGSSASSSLSTSTLQLSTDILAPVITLLGLNPTELDFGTPYIDLGATVSDNTDKNLGLHTLGDVIDTHIPGTYSVIYIATDQALNRATSTREVIVKSKPTPLLSVSSTTSSLSSSSTTSPVPVVSTGTSTATTSAHTP